MNYIPEFLRDSMAEARERLSDWRSLEDRFTGDGVAVETREYLNTPMPEPPPIPAPEYSRSVKGGSMELNWRPKPKRKSFTNLYPAKRESPTFDRRDCTVCGKTYEPTGAAQTTCGPECRRVRRTESQQRTEVRAMAGARQGLDDLRGLQADEAQRAISGGRVIYGQTCRRNSARLRVIAPQAQRSGDFGRPPANTLRRSESRRAFSEASTESGIVAGSIVRDQLRIGLQLAQPKMPISCHSLILCRSFDRVHARGGHRHKNRKHLFRGCWRSFRRCGTVGIVSRVQIGVYRGDAIRRRFTRPNPVRDCRFRHLMPSVSALIAPVVIADFDCHLMLPPESILYQHGVYVNKESEKSFCGLKTPHLQVIYAPGATPAKLQKPALSPATKGKKDFTCQHFRLRIIP